MSRYRLHTVWFVFCMGIGSFGLAQHKEETQKSQVELRHNNTEYQNCRRTALRLIKEGKVSAEGFKSRVEGCTERFPAASIYIECKKNALGLRNKELIKKNLKHCKQQLLRFSFDAAEPFPFSTYQKKLFFGGIGLNETLPIQNFKLPNFDCHKLSEGLNDLKKAEYFLFGNHPSVFLGFRSFTGTSLMAQLKVSSRPPKAGALVNGLGRIFGDISKPTGSLFFPSESCLYTGEFGNHFSGMSAYYLIDSKDKLAVPYFGIAFFKNKTIKIPELARSITQLLKDLGAEKVKQSSLVGKTIFLGSEEILSFDADGDPRDVCKGSRRMSYLGAIKKASDSADYPEYALVVNLKNLCEFGDQVSLRFKKN